MMRGLAFSGARVGAYPLIQLNPAHVAQPSHNSSFRVFILPALLLKSRADVDVDVPMPCTGNLMPLIICCHTALSALPAGSSD